MTQNRPGNADRSSVGANQREPDVDVVVVYRDGQIGLRRIPESWSQGFSDVVPQPLTVAGGGACDTILNVPRRDYRRTGHMFDGRPLLCEKPFRTDEYVVEASAVPGTSAYVLEEMHRVMERHSDAALASTVDEKRETTSPTGPPFLFKYRHRRILAVLSTRVIPVGTNLGNLHPRRWRDAPPIEQRLFLSRLNRQSLIAYPTCPTCGFPDTPFCRACDQLDGILRSTR